MANDKHTYSPLEETANTITHGLGVLLSLAGLFTLLYYNNLESDIWRTVGFSIYGSSLILLYLSSTLYHGTKDSKLKKIFKRRNDGINYLFQIKKSP